MEVASSALANRHIVATILHHLSNMKYKDRRQRGPDQPVELLEFRPTLVPSILVNHLWADEGTSILWKRYPHLPALQSMDPPRRQVYANKVHQIFSMGPRSDIPHAFDYLEDVAWPNLKSLELEVDFSSHGPKFASMLRPSLEHLELSGLQNGGSSLFANTALPSLFATLENLKSIRFGPGTFPDDDPVHASALFEYIDSLSTINVIEVKAAGFAGVDSLFARLSQRVGLEGLEIDLEPGLAMLPLLQGPNLVSRPFQSLRQLNIMCYPEIALALLPHLKLLKKLQLDICRIPNQEPQEFDRAIIDSLLDQLTGLQEVKIGIGALSSTFPSSLICPKLSGASLAQFGQASPDLVSLNIFAAEPAAVDGSSITSDDFNVFCQSVPRLQYLSLKLHPLTTSVLEETALQSLGKHCLELEILRLKIPFKLPSLPVPSTLPQILISAPGTPALEHELTTESNPPTPMGSASSAYFSFTDFAGDPSPGFQTSILFPRLVHIALSRPESVLAPLDDSFTASTASQPESVNPELEENLVRSWAHPLLVHFPRLEILEAWGDWTGSDNESLNYFLPTEEILASTWEFLSGVEQDLWDDGEADEEIEYGHIYSWHTHESSDDWEAAASLNEFVPEEEASIDHGYTDEPEGYITPGRTIDHGEYFGNDLESLRTSAPDSTAPIAPRSHIRTSSRLTEGVSQLEI